MARGRGTAAGSKPPPAIGHADAPSTLLCICIWPVTVSGVFSLAVVSLGMARSTCMYVGTKSNVVLAFMFDCVLCVLWFFVLYFEVSEVQYVMLKVFVSVYAWEINSPLN